MTITRRNILGLFAAGSATALAGCGGGGDGYDDAPTRFVRVLNLNPEFPSVDVAIDATVVVTNVPFEALTPAIELVFGTYSIGLRDRASARVLYFDGFGVDDRSPSLEVFYRKGASARLGPSPLGIVNYFDSSESLVAELSDASGNTQTSVLAFEASAPQVSQSLNCRLRLRRASDNVLVYDSGSRQRTDAILIYPADASSGLVRAMGVNHTYSTASAVVWPNIL